MYGVVSLASWLWLSNSDFRNDALLAGTALCPAGRRHHGREGKEAVAKGSDSKTLLFLVVSPLGNQSSSYGVYGERHQ